MLLLFTSGLPSAPAQGASPPEPPVPTVFELSHKEGFHLKDAHIIATRRSSRNAVLMVLMRGEAERNAVFSAFSEDELGLNTPMLHALEVVPVFQQVGIPILDVVSWSDPETGVKAVMVLRDSPQWSLPTLHQALFDEVAQRYSVSTFTMPFGAQVRRLRSAATHLWLVGRCPGRLCFADGDYIVKVKRNQVTRHPEVTAACQIFPSDGENPLEINDITEMSGVALVFAGSQRNLNNERTPIIGTVGTLIAGCQVLSRLKQVSLRGVAQAYTAVVSDGVDRIAAQGKYEDGRAFIHVYSMVQGALVGGESDVDLDLKDCHETTNPVGRVMIEYGSAPQRLAERMLYVFSENVDRGSVHQEVLKPDLQGVQRFSGVYDFVKGAFPAFSPLSSTFNPDGTGNLALTSSIDGYLNLDLFNGSSVDQLGDGGVQFLRRAPASPWVPAVCPQLAEMTGVTHRDVTEFLTLENAAHLFTVSDKTFDYVAVLKAGGQQKRIADIVKTALEGAGLDGAKAAVLDEMTVALGLEAVEGGFTVLPELVNQLVEQGVKGYSVSAESPSAPVRVVMKNAPAGPQAWCAAANAAPEAAEGTIRIRFAAAGDQNHVMEQLLEQGRPVAQRVVRVDEYPVDQALRYQFRAGATVPPLPTSGPRDPRSLSFPDSGTLGERTVLPGMNIILQFFKKLPE